MRYDRVLGLIRAGELGCVDLRSPGSPRPVYRLFREHIVEFYRRRSNNIGKADVARRRCVHRRPLKDYLS